jgi:hypothetical protein
MSDGFRMYKGNAISENGWRICTDDILDRGSIPGTGIKIALRRGIPTLILKGWASWYNTNVEPLEGGAPDEGGWTFDNSVANSNHLSGTAVDLNWNKYPFRQLTMGQAKVGKVQEGLEKFRGCVWWGRDWVSPKDEMHYQLNFREGDARLAALATVLQNGYLGIWTAQEKRDDVHPVGVVLRLGDQGDEVRKLQALLNRDYPLYSHLEEDGDFGPATDSVVREFQRRAGLLVDGIVGPETLIRLGLTF